ncbi:MAG TPA: DUF6799 domain-containing protein [Cytophagaceae bacterium]|jgi:hypothetical protein|nr:DUF6799 domain-containing protein [Cytophagaceae bacterium]
MKTLLKILLLSGAVYYAFPGQAQNSECKIFKDGVVMKDGKVFSFDKNGVMIPLEEDKELSNGIKISKTGEYKTATGSKAKMKNGEIFSSKGDMMVLSDYAVKMEGATMKDGKVWIIKDAASTMVEGPSDFGDGLKASNDGTITLKDGSTIALKEGELVTPQGELIRKRDDLFSLDGVAIRGGKAMKWDGSKYVPLSADMTLGTSGAKVSPAGVVTAKDGSTTKLGEGSMINSKGEMALVKTDVVSDGVFKRDGKMMLLSKGKVSPLTTDYALANGAKVSTDGNLILNASDKMALRDGEMVLANGELILLRGGKVDTKLVDERKTSDHYIFRNGKMMFVKDGDPQILQQDIAFANGSKLLKHGHVIKKDGTKHILKEGEKLDMDGNFIVDRSKSEYDEKNNIVMKMGKMIQVKDGKEIPMTSEILMPDWSKIYPDGTVEKQNGTKTKMKEGERFNMEGESMAKLNTGYTGPTVASTTKTPTTTTTTTATTTSVPATTQTLILLKGGKTVIQMGAKEIPMSKERMLNNGTKIATDGTVTKKDGSGFKMKEGDKVDYNTGEPVK